jgi:FAD/FMN-containing dehydrogenase
MGFFRTAQNAVTVDASASVGIAGDFGQGGGHGPLSPKYGLTVDNAIELDVVTADDHPDKSRTCVNPEFHKAMWEVIMGDV